MEGRAGNKSQFVRVCKLGLKNSSRIAILVIYENKRKISQDGTDGSFAPER